MTQKNLIIIAIIIVLVATGAFFLGKRSAVTPSGIRPEENRAAGQFSGGVDVYRFTPQ